ncbi:MAG: multidrug efflux RND transporter permease subunit [Planctomycetes bacterium]|nr:multidrug efflux RND transporter permease subunit [Planctomycetota bacterium]NBY01764.1 multidrug efflux RND transporter permease subunit [Planctomycetota bacterium]
MISNFFIDRPIFATVVSVFVTIAGALALITLPVAQYPPVAPPTVQVSVVYPGASAQVVSDTIAAPIEQQVNGVENMLFMSSTCDNTGLYNLTVTFALNTDLNTALVAVQNRVNLAVPQLPKQVQKQGLMIKKKAPQILLSINFTSPDGRYDDIFLSNYATIHIKDEVFRLEGVGDIVMMGQRDYAIRAWLDPQKLASLNLSSNDVINAIQQQNAPLSAGKLGQSPSPDSTETQYPFSALGRLENPEQFGDIIVKTITASNNDSNASPKFVRLKDLGRVEFGALRYDMSSTVDGLPSVALSIFQLPGTNALDVAAKIKKKMEQLAKNFPPGMAYSIVYDTTPFISESIAEVFKTLQDAIILVGIVVLIFLQSWRATLIPLIAVPVAIIGTFAVMALLGYSINNISLFGLVLAIGIVVDDAIVVVENVERWLHKGATPRDAARNAMKEVTGPVIAVALVLCAVFIPCTFISGITGQFFRQFAVTISVSTVLSAINSLTLSPALAAILLKPPGTKKDPLQFLLDLFLGWFFWLFEKTFVIGTNGYGWMVTKCLRYSILVLAFYLFLVFATVGLFAKIPKGFIPTQDQGWLLMNVLLPDGASLQRSQQLMAQIEKETLKIPGVAHTFTTSGFSFLYNAFASNNASMFVVLAPFNERKSKELSATALTFKITETIKQFNREAKVQVLPTPPVPGIGVAGGFQLMLEDRGDLGAFALEKETQTLVDQRSSIQGLYALFTLYQARNPQLFADIDRDKVKALQVKIQDVNNAMNSLIGSLFVNNFNAFGRFWQVTVMAEPEFRDKRENLDLINLTNSNGQMVPLSTLVNFKPSNGPNMVNRYNLYPAAQLIGINLPWILSSADAVTKMNEKSLEVLSPAMKTEWTGLSFLQIMEGQDIRNKLVFPLSVVFVFLVLSAQYESWGLPLAVILVVPVCIFSALVGTIVGKTGINLFTEIGLVVLVGLCSKNSILIIEFAKQLHEEGKSVRDATVEACKLRLRPILMTSFAFILGVVPLVIAEGAGAEMRQALGVAVFSGMLGVTVMGVLFTPVFFYAIESLGSQKIFKTKTAVIINKSTTRFLSITTLGLLAKLRNNTLDKGEAK